MTEISLKKKSIMDKIKPAVIFFLGIIPFYMVIPYLEFKYAGAIFGGANLGFPNVYQFFESYLSSFDLSFLFVRGDEILHHSTGIHGAYLLAGLPLILAGIYSAVRKKGFWLFIVILFFSGPLLIGVVGSIHRASRLMAMVPFYAILSALGAKSLWEAISKVKFNKILITFYLILFGLNTYDFLKYYWYTYPSATNNIFFHTNISESYKELANKSAELDLTPYMAYEIVAHDTSVNRFLKSIYFSEEPMVWKESGEKLPKESVLLTPDEKLKSLEKVNVDLPYGQSLYINK